MMKLRSLSCLAMGLVTALAQPAVLAADNQVNQSKLNNTEAGSGFGHAYLGVKAGYSSFADSCYAHYSDCDNDQLAYGIWAGYQFTPWLALELDAQDYGKYRATYESRLINADIKGYAASFKLSQPVSENTEAYLRLGGVYMDVERGAPFSVANDSGWRPVGAIGLAFQLTSSLTLRTEYQYINDVGGSDNHYTSLGLSYRFGQQKKPHAAMATSQPERGGVEPFNGQTVAVNALPEYATAEVFDMNYVPEPLLFAFDSASLTAASKQELKRVAEFKKQYPDSVVWLMGYTDKQGPSAYNLKLSQQRALSAARYLVELGVRNIRVKGKGEVMSSSPMSSPKDRKVVVILADDNPPGNW